MLPAVMNGPLREVGHSPGLKHVLHEWQLPRVIQPHCDARAVQDQIDAVGAVQSVLEPGDVGTELVRLSPS